MALEIGAILEGKVTGITKFGAFVELPDGQTGMVHISEVAVAYVKEVADHLTEGQTIKVKVLAVGENGKISLSIRKAEEPAPRSKPAAVSPGRPGGYEWHPAHAEGAFEDMMSHFKKASEEKISDLKRTTENKHGGFSRRGRHG